MLPDLRWTCQLMYVPACKFVRWIGRSLWKITWRWDPWFLRWYGTQGVAWYSWSMFWLLVVVCGEMPHFFLKSGVLCCDKANIYQDWRMWWCPTCRGNLRPVWLSQILWRERSSSTWLELAQLFTALWFKNCYGKKHHQNSWKFLSA